MLICHEDGYRYYDAICQNNLPIVFSAGAQEERRCRWMDFGEMKEQHPESKMVRGAITFVGEVAMKIGLLSCPDSVNNVTDLEMVMMGNVFQHLVAESGAKEFHRQQDNAPVHGPAGLHIAQDFLCLKWPHTVLTFNYQKESRDRRSRNKNESFQAAQDKWANIPGRVIRNLVGSFFARCKVCMELEGQCLNGHWRHVHHPADPQHVPLNPAEEPDQNVRTVLFDS